MKVFRLGHASILVDGPDAGCLMDPVLVDPFEGGCSTFSPPIAIDPDALDGCYNAIVISHDHMDHFCVRSLHLLDRSCPVFFPRGSRLIAFALETMGFERPVEVGAGERVKLGGLEVTFTSSAAPVNELGALFKQGDRTFWNCVDTMIDDQSVRIAAEVARRVDLMFAPFQPMLEAELALDALGASFPADQYGQLLRAVVSANPRCVVPFACGLRFAGDDWRNARGFPVTEEDFLEDVARLDGNIAAVQVPHAAAIEVADLGIERDAAPFARAVDSPAVPVTAWRPDAGVPPLRDLGPEDGSGELSRQIEEYLRGPFSIALGLPRHVPWLRRLSLLRVVWRLDVVYPGGGLESRYLDFAAATPSWRDRPPRPPKMITAIPASILRGLLTGEVNGYRANLTRRVALRLYEPSPLGTFRVGSLEDEPISRITMPDADWRFVRRELSKLGYAAD